MLLSKLKMIIPDIGKYFVYSALVAQGILYADITYALSISSYNSTIISEQSGTTIAWGHNNGQLGDGGKINRLTAISLPAVKNITFDQLSTGYDHTLAVDDKGQVYSWGGNSSAQLGNGTTKSHFAPLLLAGLKNVVSVASGPTSSLAVKSDGSVYVWGDNNDTSPAVFNGISDVKFVSAGYVGEGGKNFSIALKKDGSVWSWNNNACGNLGDGTNTNSLIPVQVLGLDDIVSISAGNCYALALTQSGTVYSWGNQYGRSNGTVTSTTVANMLPLKNIKAISAGGQHALALDDSGNIWVWGNNNQGQLGIGSLVAQSVPVKLNMDKQIIAIAAGKTHSVAIQSDGMVLAWGGNANGQIGNNKSGFNAKELLPVSVLDSDLRPLVVDVIKDTKIDAKNIPPSADFKVVPGSGDASLKITLDASNSNDSDGEIIEYMWDTSIGVSAKGKHASMTFNQGGDITITLTITDDHGAIATKEKSITIAETKGEPDQNNDSGSATNESPIADFTFSPNTGKIPLKVDLDASKSSDYDGGISKYSWISSDGKTTTGKIASMEFTKTGSYEITLIVTDNLGATNSKKATVAVLLSTAKNNSPVASFTYAQDLSSSQNVRFDASASTDSDGSISAYTWKSSNGMVANGKTVSLAFSNPGTYSINLTVTDDKGATTNTAQDVIIKQKEIPVTPATTAKISVPMYNETARLKPQVIMSGVSPAIIDLTDTSFDILALVRSGPLPIKKVTIGQVDNPLFNVGLKHINTLKNGDQFWKTSFAFKRGTFGTQELPIEWGNSSNQFFVRVVDAGQQTYEGSNFPTIEFSNAPAQEIIPDQTKDDNVSYNSTIRVAPQVIMAGVSPAIVDIYDTSFDIVSIVRPGAVPIKNVVLKQGGTGDLFNISMEKKQELGPVGAKLQFDDI